MTIQIDRNRHFPQPRGKYPWPLMHVGQSFIVNSAAERDNALHGARQRKLKATSRKIGDSKYRLWLVGKDSA